MAKKTLRELERLCKADFRNFLKLSFYHRRRPEPTRLQYHMADMMQKHRRIIVHAARGRGKTTLAADFGLYEGLKDPDTREVVFSAGDKFSSTITGWMHGLLKDRPIDDNDALPYILEPLRPRPGQNDAKDKFDFGPATTGEKDPSVISVGIKGQFTGRRPKLAILDDIETPQNSRTVTEREILATYAAAIEHILEEDSGESRVIVLGTPQTEETVYKKISKKGYKVIVLPIRYPEPDYADFLGDDLAPMLREDITKNPDLMRGGGINKDQGQVTEPERMNEERCQEKEVEITGDEGASQWRLQYHLDIRVTDKGRFPLRMEETSVMDLDIAMGPEFVTWGREVRVDIPTFGFSGDYYYAPRSIGRLVPWDFSVLYVDPSSRGEDESGLAVIRALNGNLFVAWTDGIFGGATPENSRYIAKLAYDMRVQSVQIEPNYGDGSWRLAVLPYMMDYFASVQYTCGIIDSEYATNQMSKEVRNVRTLAPIFNSHRLIWCRKNLERDAHFQRAGCASEKVDRYRAAYQITHLTEHKNSLAKDDRVDAISGGCRAALQGLGKSQQVEVARRKIAELNDGIVYRFGTQVTKDGRIITNQPKRQFHGPEEQPQWQADSRESFFKNQRTRF